MLQETAPATTKLTVWHDGGCPLCRREIAWLRRLDWARRINFVDVSTAEAVSCPANRADLLTRFHAREGNVVLSGAAAFAAMWRPIPVLRPLGLLANNRIALAILELCYRLFLRIRPHLQRFALRWEAV